ncbi:hypothetical protein UREOM_3200 [Ureaplasma sp. OM1]|uniref:Uncharacterized protein n=1 Tax=Ureaplasma ceti TaxID=3119530 RepID=A0ABP9UAW1_9BACT
MANKKISWITKMLAVKINKNQPKELANLSETKKVPITPITMKLMPVNPRAMKITHASLMIVINGAKMLT